MCTKQKGVLGVFLFVLVLGLTGALAAELWEQLQPQGYVSDFAGVLSAPERAALETYLRQLEQQTGVEIAVVTLQSLAGGQVDDFANRLFSRWGIGKKAQDNGALILAAIQERTARIEVGYGLENKIPDALAGRILRGQLFPAFKAERYGEGLRAAAYAVAQAATGTADSSVPSGNSPFDRIPAWLWIVVALLFIVRQSFFRHARGWSYGPGSSSGGFGGSSGGFGGFGGGSSGGGGASGRW